jgi:hypothetical protein
VGDTPVWFPVFDRSWRFAAINGWSWRREPGVLVELGVVEQRARTGHARADARARIRRMLIIAAR